MKQTAQGLAALGRGPDTQLVHMAPSEVRSLQQLAMANGGSLTTNPDTGLPEAGFLSSILPMVIGAGLSVASGGALTPMMAAMMTGGGYGLATGSLKNGLMAGLGAYGGAGLGGALAEAGMQASIAPQLAQTQSGISGLAEAANAAGAPSLVGATPGTLSAAGEQYASNILGQTQPYVDATNAARTAFTNAGPVENLKTMGQGIQSLSSDAGRGAFMTSVGGNKGLMQTGMMAASPMMETATKQPEMMSDKDMGQRYSYLSNVSTPTPTPDVPGYDSQGQNFGAEQTYFRPQYAQIDDERAKSVYGFASGGPVEAMSNANAIGANTGFPQSDIRTTAYSIPFQQPTTQNIVAGAQDVAVDPYTGQEQRSVPAAEAQFAMGGGISDLGSYSDGGRLLRGPGDGISDSIPAMIGKKRPARLADGEFVVPARIVSELGNGSTEAGARKLYAMMDRVQKSRGKTVGKGKVAVNSRATKHLPA